MAKATQSERGIRAIKEVVSTPSTDAGASSKKADKPPASQPTPEERHARIAEIAYRNAGKRGFAPGGEVDDWLTAEREYAANSSPDIQ